MCGYTRADRISHVVIREKVGVTPIDDKMREARLGWFDHFKRRSLEAPVRRYEKINPSGGRRGRGRSRKSCEVIRHDVKTLGLTEDVTQDKKLWRAWIKRLRTFG